MSSDRLSLEVFYRSERLEGQRCFGAFDPVDIEQVIVDVFARVLFVGNVELEQKVERAGGGIKLGMDFALGDILGHTVGGAGFAADVDEHGAHGVTSCESGGI